MSSSKPRQGRQRPPAAQDIPGLNVEPITDSAALSEFCAHLAEQPFVTIDTEFIRDRTYYPRLCLIQAASAERALAIDPLAEGLDLAPFLELMQNQSVLKVFHAARQDLEIFYHLTGLVPGPLFDTQIAAMVCGFGESVGYERLVQVIARGSVDKVSRFTDWSRRPLDDRQIRYALNDVTYLQTIYNHLAERLERSGRAHWLNEEMAVLSDPATYDLQPDAAWRRLKIRSRKPRYLAVLIELATWREEEAQRRNMPRAHVLRDEGIYELAAECPTQPDGLRRLRAVPNGLADGETGRAILAAIKRGLARPAEDLPAYTEDAPLPKGLGPLTDLLKTLLRLSCEEHDVAQKLVATVSELEKIAADDNADVPALRGWRREIFGSTALDLKHGRIGLGARDRAVQVVRLDKS